MAKKKNSILPIIALGGIGILGIYALSQYGGSDDTTGTGGWTGGTGTRSLTPIVTETTKTTETVPIGGGEYPQIVLPAISPYEQPALPEWLFAPPAPTMTAAPPPTAPAPTTKKEPAPSPFGAGGGFGGGGAGGRGGDLGTVKLSESWVGSLTGITVYGETGSITYPVSLSTDGAPTSKKAVHTGGGGGKPAKEIQSFFSAGKDYSTPTYTKPAPGGGTTYHYKSGAFQTVQQGQITVSGSAGSVQGLRELASQGNKTAQMLASKAGLI